MESHKTTPKDFFLWAGAVVSLYWSVVAFIFLMFDYINYAMPNPLVYYPSDPYQSGIPLEMASIIILVPVYFALMWIIRRDIAKDASRGDIWVRRWAIIFTLFIAGVSIAIDLIVLLTTFLRGEEITLAFFYKVAVVLLVAAGIFMHFIADFWGYWYKFPKRRFNVFIGVGVLMVATIVAGFFIIGTPMQARLMRFDSQKISDLQNIQYQILNYYQQRQFLPTTLSDINTSISNNTIPVDAETNQQYEYRLTGELSFELCATFNSVGDSGDTGARAVSYPTPAGVEGYYMNGIQDNWQHTAGHICFSRTIDPQLYPAVNTKGMPQPPLSTDPYPAVTPQVKGL